MSSVCDIKVDGQVGSAGAAAAEAHSHSHSHAGAGEHGHTHPIMEHPGKFSQRDLPDYSKRDWQERAFTVGLGGPVGSGKTALLLALCRKMSKLAQIGVVCNDIWTREDQEFLIKNSALEPVDRIRAVETGGCPHAAIREDISANMLALENVQADYNPQLLFVESGESRDNAPMHGNSQALLNFALSTLISGGDNLAASYSKELVDYEIYVVDVAGGDKVPRKGGPGVTASDLLVINKTDLAPHVGASLAVMDRDSRIMREGGPFCFTSVRNDEGVQEVIQHILEAWKASGADVAWQPRPGQDTRPVPAPAASA